VADMTKSVNGYYLLDGVIVKDEWIGGEEE
jgi:hypothetical protein